MQGGWVYIMTNGAFGTLYVGVTNDLARRIDEHRSGTADSFTSRYKAARLAWAERHDNIVPAIKREKAIKYWRRCWKIDLITADNPNWDDLAVRWL
jgi:putative endonuclease